MCLCDIGQQLLWHWALDYKVMRYRVRKKMTSVVTEADYLTLTPWLIIDPSEKKKVILCSAALHLSRKPMAAEIDDSSGDLKYVCGEGRWFKRPHLLSVWEAWREGSPTQPLSSTPRSQNQWECECLFSFVSLERLETHARNSLITS